jgi:hypothetical protein
LSTIHVVQLMEHYLEESEDHARAPRTVRAFRSRAAADAFRLALEDVEVVPPPAINPFGGWWYLNSEYADAQGVAREGGRRVAGGTLSFMTSLGDEGYRALVASLGLDAPEPFEESGRPMWHRWWRRVAAPAPAAVRQRLWRELDRLWFFEVVDTELEE